jgi:hypothetical protein
MASEAINLTPDGGVTKLVRAAGAGPVPNAGDEVEGASCSGSQPRRARV